MASVTHSRVLPFLIVVMGLALGWFYNNQVSPAAEVLPIEVRYSLSSLHGLDSLKIDYSVLLSDQFKQLQVFGELPVVPQPGGKSNPFQ